MQNEKQHFKVKNNNVRMNGGIILNFELLFGVLRFKIQVF